MNTMVCMSTYLSKSCSADPSLWLMMSLVIVFGSFTTTILT